MSWLDDADKKLMDDKQKKKQAIKETENKRKYEQKLLKQMWKTHKGEIRKIANDIRDKRFGLVARILNPVRHIHSFPYNLGYEGLDAPFEGFLLVVENQRYLCVGTYVMNGNIEFMLGTGIIRGLRLGDVDRVPLGFSTFLSSESIDILRQKIVESYKTIMFDLRKY